MFTINDIRDLFLLQTMKIFLFNLLGIAVVLAVIFGFFGFVAALMKLCNNGFGGFIAAAAIVIAIILYIISKIKHNA